MGAVNNINHILYVIIPVFVIIYMDIVSNSNRICHEMLCTWAQSAIGTIAAQCVVYNKEVEKVFESPSFSPSIHGSK